ncbi:MAG: DUF4126 domain-containing protein, partial [Bryobacteraceae bacterium]
ALSVVEDVFAVGASALMVSHPLIILGAVAVFLTLAVWMLPKIFRALQRMFARLRSLFGGAGPPYGSMRKVE